MLKTVLLFFIVFSFTACDSPMNHRVTSDEGGSQKVTTATAFNVYKLNTEVQWLVGPVGNVNKTNQMLVVISDLNGSPVSLPSELTLSFYATMPGMGHAMDDAGFFEEISTGIYLNKAIRYNMSGEWKNELWIIDSEFNVKDKVEWLIFF